MTAHVVAMMRRIGRAESRQETYNMQSTIMFFAKLVNALQTNNFPPTRRLKELLEESKVRQDSLGISPVRMPDVQGELLFTDSDTDARSTWIV